jgi:UDP-N-acetylglucosamine transferase subunit ALG13
VTQPFDYPIGNRPGIDRLFVTVGTDYHRFDRMVWWLDEWLATKPSVDSVIVQRGTSTKSEHAESVDYFQRTQLIEEFQRASTVVCHGGPATILECRSNGIVPIVVPREGRFDEHVNDHQVDFCERLAAHGEIQMARTKDEFFRLLDLATQPGVPEVAGDDGHAANSLLKFEDRMIELLGQRAAVHTGPLAEVVPIRDELKQIPVLFIGSVPRSGSTILSDLLNENPHMVNIGELVHLWERGVIGDHLCGCGERFSDCAFWGKVGDIAFGGWQHVSGERMRTLQLRADRTRHIPALLVPKVSRLLATSTVQYGAVISRILRAILKVSGKPVIVDTSKHVSTALLLRQLPDIDLRVVHLVRDPRGVANSWSRVVARPEVQDEDRDMDTLHPGRLGLRWLWFNWAFSNMDRLGVPTLTIRYEDFVDEPAGILDQIFGFAGVEMVGEKMFDPSSPLILQEGHSVSGNPRRLNRRPVELRADEKWRTDLDPKMSSLVSRVTRPMLDRYRYTKDF